MYNVFQSYEIFLIHLTVELTGECKFQVSSIDILITDSLPFLNLSTSILVPSRLSFLPSVVLPPVKLSERIEKSNS